MRGVGVCSLWASLAACTQQPAAEASGEASAAAEASQPVPAAEVSPNEPAAVVEAAAAVAPESDPAAAAAAGAETPDAFVPAPTGPGGCSKVGAGALEGLRLVSKAAAVGSDIDQTFEFATGRVSGTGYRMVESTLEPVQVEHQTTPEAVEAMKAALADLCVPTASSSGEAPKGFLRYGVVMADGSERWLVVEGADAGLAAGAQHYVVPRDTFIELKKRWPVAKP